MFGKNKAIGLSTLATNRKICIATVAALTLTGFSSRAQTADPTNHQEPPILRLPINRVEPALRKRRAIFSLLPSW
jgi:hypothetical protein